MREIIIDGSEGEGGGQVLRTSLSLSAITGKPLRIENVRGKRKKPGLARQHLTALQAAAEICNAKTEGAELKSTEIVFHPGKIVGGEYRFDIGTAGATNLVAQTILPILSFADTPCKVTITGGTHNIWAPTFDFLDQAFLPQLRKMGGRASAELIRYGFYPAGGGEIVLSVKPTAEPKRIELTDRGKRLDTNVIAVIANLKRDIANREIKAVLRQLNLPPEKGEIIQVDGPGPGNVVSLFLEYLNITEVFMGVGQHGVRAETLAKAMAKNAQEFIANSDAAVNVHLADQLLLPMALMGGGTFTTNDITEHTRTNIDIIQRFLDVNIKLSQTGRKCWMIDVSGSSAITPHI